MLLEKLKNGSSHSTILKSMRVFHSNAGSSLLYVIAGVVILAAVGAGMTQLTTRTTMTALRANAGFRAYYMALAGKNYAEGLGQTELDALSSPVTLTITGYGTITLSATPHATLADAYDVQSLGTVEGGSSLEANYQLGFVRKLSDISFKNDIGDFKDVTAGSGEDIIKVDQVEKTITLGNKNWNTYGSVWYAGNETSGGCLTGGCLFGKGFRAYFTFDMPRFKKQWWEWPWGSEYYYLDGFTFSVVNAEDNDISRTGGDISHGENLGYSGSGNTADKKGLIPPKFAVEFDASEQSTDYDPQGGYSRNDGTHPQHLAYVFWGYDDPSNSCDLDKICGISSTCGRYWLIFRRDPYICPYDDNRHSIDGPETINVGDGLNGDQPINSVSKLTHDATSYYRDTTNPYWLSNGIMNFRIEVQRSEEMNANGFYEYSIKSWVDCENCDNVSRDFKDAPPTLNRTIELKESLHEKFERFLFGWTMGTGGASQEITLSDFRISFR